MSSEWPLTSIESLSKTIAMGPFGSSIKKETYVDAGVPVINGKHLHQVRLNDAVGYGFIREEHADALPRANAYPGDVVITHRGTLGQVSFIPKSSEFERYVISQSQMLVRPDPSRLNGAFLMYYLRSTTGQAKLLSFASQTGVPSLTQPTTSLKRIFVPTPPITVQEAIVDVLGALDDKIEANSRLVHTCHRVGEALFQTADRSGQKKLLGEVVTLNYGKALPGTRRLPGEIKVVGSGGHNGYHNESLINSSGVVVGRKGTVGSIHWVDGPHWPIDTTYWVQPNLDEVPLEYTYYLLRSLPLSQMNNDSAVPGLNRNEAYGVPIRLPDATALKDFSKNIQPIFALAKLKRRESATLSDIRDGLLPQLMSGKLRIKDAEQRVEALV